MKRLLTLPLLCLVSLLSACQTPSDSSLIFDSGNQTQLQVRSYQSRSFDTGNKALVMRAVISTLQDYGFIINRTDFDLGTISATKDIGGSHLYDEPELDPTRKTTHVTITIAPKGKNMMVVRMNSEFRRKPVCEAKIYQDFFSSLSKSLFLAAHSVD